MPELPEVETIVRTLRPALVGAEIAAAETRWTRTVAFPSARQFRERIRGQRVLGVGRRAKFIHLQLSDYSLFVHLRMSGDLYIKEDGYKPEKHDRLILRLASRGTGTRGLVFNDARKFGRVWLTDDPDSVVGDLGPEPLSDAFTPAWLHENLRRRHRQLKPLLLDQRFLAGLGNIYTDEALHAARLHPQAASDSVTRKQAERLHAAIRAALTEGIRRNGASIDWAYRGGEFQNYFRVYDRQGSPCPVCGTKIVKLAVGQRGTHVCPKCQKKRSV
ncbi:MAG: formamidopyrimidine-DNA glycosylase [Anaerolineaceae bacterium]|jgi:formamidopyrimidine-DNA glycosylase|nr:bifunctional DNA-formamidopyrimidine glycosylase/DNA-(apurinic or apyrimidinic site) lyase [Anaerolineae bacterium]MCE7904772.1 bifunctional DNA-formamidopyrimidine glycosylase/DNA-(apurinic or apyrimidinic site) lyase [Anaerolineae bacterium CFX3]MCL4823965.1 bifunctional DNA-formamidopyrimidine glycosylase/DNA-(apurinic or apyrimidinic site) lyase [Anaerolineales bacterium]MDL1926282.1 bifunctional DNA-formamidopyrimidine glycosylase/DNA-(apurinic or apyrimidinic site) lyase [Anaerolineae b